MGLSRLSRPLQNQLLLSVRLLLVLHRANNIVRSHSHDRHAQQSNAQRVAEKVRRLVLSRKRKCGYESSTVAKPDLPRGPYGTVLVTFEVHDEPADDDRHSTKDAHGIQTKGAIAGMVVGALVLEQSNDTNQGEEKIEHDEGKPLLGFIRCICHDHRKTEGRSPWWNGVQLGLYR